jgi:hypothetical protein
MAFFKSFEENAGTLSRSMVPTSDYECVQLILAAISSHQPVLEAVHDYIKAHPRREDQTYNDLKDHIVAQIPTFATSKFIHSAIHVASAAILPTIPNLKAARAPTATPTAAPPRSAPPTLPAAPQCPADKLYCWLHGYGHVGAPGAHRGRDCTVMRAAGITVYPRKFVNSTKHSWGVAGETGCSTVY